MTFFLEFMPRGSVYNYLHSSEPITNAQRLKVIAGAASGMMHLVKEGVVHRDLAARNLLLTKDFDAKIWSFFDFTSFY